MLSILAVAATAVAPPALAGQAREVETLIRGGIDSGGFGSPVLKFAEMEDRFGMIVGFRGGWIIDHSFVVGGGIYGLTNTQNFGELTPAPFGPGSHLFMGYGGLELEWIIASHKVVHLSLQSLVGAGGVGYEWDSHQCCDDEHADAFFIVEPGANLILNVHKVFRIGLGGSYRFVHDVNLEGITNETLRGPAGVLTLKFGSF